MTDITVNWREVVVCPLCDSIQRHWYTAKFWSTLSIDFWMCECGLVYAGTVPDGDEEIAKYYDEFYTPLTVSQWGIERLKDNELERAVRVVPSLRYEKVERHLDVGCAWGKLMEEMQSKYSCVSEGEDIRALAEDHKVYGDLAEIEGTYDLITSLHSLEHMIDPVGFLKALKPLCSKHLFLEVPSFSPELGVLSPHHLFGFTTHSLAKTLEKAGWYPTLIRQVMHSVTRNKDGFNRGKIELQAFAEVKGEEVHTET